MPRRYYRRSVGEVDLFLLDSNRLGERQLGWLDRALAASDAVWRVVALHHPPYSCGGYRGHEPARRLLVPLFRRHDVDLVLAGHDHNYQRFGRRDGVTYVVHGGGGGARMYPLKPCPRWMPPRVAARKAHGWLYLEASPVSLRVRAVEVGGGVHDDFALYPRWVSFKR